MGNRVKSLFCSVLFNEFHHTTKLMALLFSSLYLKNNLLEFTKLWVWRVPPIQIPTQNGKMKILLSEFHPRSNLTALLSHNLVSKNKTKITSNFEGLLRVLRFCQGTIFMAWKWFYRVQKIRFRLEKCCPVYPRMKFLEQNLWS
jgi:hypothetical protein